MFLGTGVWKVGGRTEARRPVGPRPCGACLEGQAEGLELSPGVTGPGGGRVGRVSTGYGKSPRVCGRRTRGGRLEAG